MRGCGAWHHSLDLLKKKTEGITYENHYVGCTGGRKRNSGEEKTLEFDYGFVCLGMRANNPVLEELRAEFENDDVEIISIGDSVRARRIIEGVSEGRNIINVLRNRKFIK